MESLREIGEKLRAERVALGLDLEEMASRTRINKTFLESIEEGNKESLPASVYSRSFVRNYAKALNVDPKQFDEVIMSLFPLNDVVYRNYQEEKPATIKKIRPGFSSSNKKSIQLVVTLVILACLGGGLWYFFSKADGLLKLQDLFKKEEVSGAAEAVNEPQVEEQNITAPNIQVAALQQTAPEEQHSSAQVVSTPPIPLAPSSEQTAEQQSQSLLTPTPPPSEQQVPGAETGADSFVGPMDGLQLAEVLSKKECWVEVVGDEEAAKRFLMRPGQRLAVRFNKQVSFKLGNAPGVNIRLNGKDYDFDAFSSAVRTVQLP